MQYSVVEGSKNVYNNKDMSVCINRSEITGAALPVIFMPPSYAGGFHLTVITSGSLAGAATTRYGFPGADGGPKAKMQSVKKKFVTIRYNF